MNQSLTLAFLIAAGIGLVVQNTLMVRITQTSSTILIAMLLNSLVGIVLFVSILWFKQGMAGFGELVSSVLNCAPDLGQLMQPDSIDIVPG